MFRRAALSRPRTARFHLGMERLEDRTQPATVTTVADSGPGSLRDAIANSKVGEIIDFALPPGPNVITLTSGELVIPHDLFIIGPGANQLVVSGNNASRVFRNSEQSKALISGLTIANGRVEGEQEGGGIFNAGNLTLSRVIIRDNRAEPGPPESGFDGNGGGVMNFFSGALTLIDSTVFNNTADYGGGLYNFGTLTALNLTLSGNTATVFGGGLQNWGLAAVNSSTVANNTGIGIQVSGGEVTYESTLFAGNIGGNVVSLHGNGAFTSFGFNLSDDTTGNLFAPTDLPETDARLGPLANYGGSVPTHVLFPGSPAIDAGSFDLNEVDARGLPRGNDGSGDGFAAPDIGAFEVQVYTVTNTDDYTTGTLRAAIEHNNSFGGGRIEFAIDFSGVQTIRPLDPLPSITRPVFLDGWSQGGVGYTGPPLIELSGSEILPGMGANGLLTESPGVIIRGFTINSFPTDGQGFGFISGGYGIVARTFGMATPSVWIYGNYIGTDATGTVAISNAQGGILIDGQGPFTLWGDPTRGVLIGTNADGVNDLAERNVISGNDGPGIRAKVLDLTVAGNLVGLAVDGVSPLGNNGPGVQVQGQAIIGGATEDEDNIIAFNAAAGIAVDLSYEVSVYGNSIYGNTGGGIVYLPPFDPPDIPVLTSAISGDSTTIIGTIQSSFGAAPVLLQFYAEPAGTPLNQAQGRTFLGAALVDPDASGFATFNITGLLPVSVGQVITATATGPSGATSPFSVGIQAQNFGPTAGFDVQFLTAPPVGGFVAGTPIQIVVRAVDDQGNTAEDYTGTVAFFTTDPRATLPASYTFTANDAGVRVFTVILRTAGEQLVFVDDTVNPQITGELPITVRAAAASRFSLAAAGTTTAGVPIAVTVTARDPFGNIATDYTGTVALTSTDPQAVLPLPVTFTPSDAGRILVSVEYRTAGSQSLTVRDTANASITGTATTVVSPGVAVQFDVVTSQATTAGEVVTLTVRALDAYGNIASGYRGTVTFASSDPQATLPPDTAFTAVDGGRRTFTLTLRTAGSQTVTIQDVSHSMLVKTVSINVLPGDAVQFDLGPAISPTAGIPFTLTVTAFDAFGNIATGYTGSVRFTSSDGQATLPVDYTFTVADAGRRTFTVTLRTADSQTVTVRDVVTDAITGSVSATVRPGPAVRFDLFAMTATAGNPTAVLLTAFDAFGNIATGYTGTVTLTSTDSQATLPANITFTNADAGRRTVLVTYRTAGPVTLTARDMANGNITGTASTFVNPSIAVRFEVVAAGPATAGGTTRVTITPFDAFGNIATGYGGTVRFSSSDPQATLPADITFIPGGSSRTVTVTFRTAGNATLTATDVADSTVLGNTVVPVSPGAAVRFAITGLPDSTTAGTPLLVTVTAFDAFGNVATGYRGTVAFSSTDSQATLPPDYIFTARDAGRRTFAVTFATAGSQSLTVDDREGIRSTATIAVTAAAADSITVIGLTGPVIAGGESLFTVVVRDRFGNVATDYAGTITFTSTDPQAVLPAPAKLTNGSGTFTVTFRTAGNQSVTVSDGTLNGASVGNPVFAAAANRFVLSAPSPVTVGDSFELTLIAVDAFGNIAGGYTGLVRIAAGGQLTDTTFTSADVGQRTVAIILAAAGEQTITAVDAANSGLRGETVVLVTNPLPGPIMLNPARVGLGQAFTLVVTGSGFVPGSVVVFGGQELSTVFVDATRLEAAVSADVVGTVGIVPVFVRTPGPGGGDSPLATFTVSAVGMLTADPPVGLLLPIVNIPFANELGRFRTDIVDLTVADLSATVDWGDGTPVVTGEVVALPDGSFAVRATHVYADTLTHRVLVTLRGPGGIEAEVIRYAVVNTVSGFSVLGPTEVGVVFPGHPTGTLGTDGVQIQFVRADDLDRLILLRVTRYLGDPEDQANPDGLLVAAYDVQVIGAIASDQLVATFQYEALPNLPPRLQYFNTATGRYEDVIGDPLLSDSLVIDPQSGTISVIFSAASIPAVTQLLGTVFVITVSAPQIGGGGGLTTPVRIGDLGSSTVAISTAANGAGTPRMLSATGLGNPAIVEASVSDAGLIAILGPLDGDDEGGILPFLPSDELSLTIRPSQDNVFTPGDPRQPAAADNEAPPSDSVWLGPFLPDAPRLPIAPSGREPAYLNDGLRSRLRIFPDRAVQQPADPTPTSKEQGKRYQPENSEKLTDEFESRTESSLILPPVVDEPPTETDWWWASVALAAVGVGAAVPTINTRPRFRLRVESADME